MEERHLSLSEAAVALDISERTAYRWIKSGKLRAYKPGRDYWIPESAIKEVVVESEVRPKAEASPSQETLFNGVSEQERRALDALDEYSNRLEIIISKPDLDPTIATIHGYIIQLVGSMVPALWEREAIRPALLPRAERFIRLAWQLVGKAEGTAEAEPDVTYLSEWLRRAS